MNMQPDECRGPGASVQRRSSDPISHGLTTQGPAQRRGAQGEGRVGGGRPSTPVQRGQQYKNYKGQSPVEHRPSLLAFHWRGGSKGGKGCSGGGETSRKKLRRKGRKSRGLCRGKKRPLS